VALIADRWTWITTPRDIKQKSFEGILAPDWPARGRVGRRRHDLCVATVGRRECGGVGARLA